MSANIDLTFYLLSPVRTQIVELYALHGWDFQAGTGWEWPFADVCALYFRCRRHARTFAPVGEQVVKAIDSAIKDYLEDEFA